MQFGMDWACHEEVFGHIMKLFGRDDKTVREEKT